MNLNLTGKSRDDLLSLAGVVDALKQKRLYNFIDFVFPETGKYSRNAYPKVMEWYKKGIDHRFRAIFGGNGSGKTFNAAVELVQHVTGDYKSWWMGKEQKNPKMWWIIVESPGTFRDSLQKLLLGSSLNEEDFGTGLIPKDKIIGTSAWQGAGAGVVSTIEVMHASGHICTICVKSSEQPTENLSAATIDGVLIDEECRIAVYKEVIMRLRGNPTKEPGILMLVCTSVKGATDLMLKYCPTAKVIPGQHPTDPEKWITKLNSEFDCPHLTEEDIAVYKSNFSGAELRSRIAGDIMLGSGRIYPYDEEQVFIKPFEIPAYWPRCFALDFGYHCTCALWAAKDPSTKVLYFYAEYYCEGHQTTQIHALNIKARGAWIKGICDPSGGGRQDDGRLLMDLFREQGLELTPGDNSMVGIARNCNLIENGSVKFFNTMVKTKEEFMLYRWDSKNPSEPARNQKDHAMDNFKYMTSRFDWVATSEFDELAASRFRKTKKTGLDPLTGYY